MTIATRALSLSLCGLIFACSSSKTEALATDASVGPLPESDFTPCSGYDAKTPDGKDQTGLGPWASRLMIATSPDGLQFTRTGRILSDQADVPDAITLPNGEIRVYYITMCPEVVRNKIVVAVTRDGVTWSYKKTTLLGNESLEPMAVDPTVERTSDGRYRLFFTSSLKSDMPKTPEQRNKPQSFSAISEDGYTFTMEAGTRFSVEGAEVLDPNVLQIGSAWHYFAGGVPSSNFHATSTDGLTFTRVADFAMDGILMANGLKTDTGYRYYGFVQERDGSSHIRSLSTQDGTTWSVDPGNRLELDTTAGLESVGVKDPAITRMADGSYLMIYSTIIAGYPFVKGTNPPPPPPPPPPPGDGGAPRPRR